MSDWQIRTVESALVNLRLGAMMKLQTHDYRSDGRFPIIDQGQALVAGWTDDDRGLIQQDLPVIVFGDHTRAFKYIDFPFVRGADGTQILKPRPDINPRFFYYALRALNLPSRGYNRHFKALKEKDIAIPGDPAEQKAIAGALQSVDDTLSVQNDQISLWQTTKQATMRDLFTRGLRGERQRETEIGQMPESWEIVPISELGQVVTGNTPPTRDRSNYEGGNIPFIAPGDIEHGRPTQAVEKYVSEKGLLMSRPIPKDTTCFVCIGSTIGKVGKTTAQRSCTNQQINSVVASADYDADYVFHLLTYWSDHIKKERSPSPVPIMSKGVFEKVEIGTTKDEGEQREIAAILNAINAKSDLHQRKRSLLEALFSALSHKLMTREIHYSDLDLSALKTEAAA